MTCPWVGEVVHSAVRKCPFLGQIAADHGEEFAASFATSSGRRNHEPVLAEPLTDFKRSFHLFHGAKGIVPLVRSAEGEQKQIKEDVSTSECPFHTAGRASLENTFSQRVLDVPTPMVADRLKSAATNSPLAAAPFASLSTSLFRFLPGPEKFVARRRKRRQERRDKRAESSSQQSNQNRAQSNQSKIDKWRHNPVLGGLIPLNSAGKYACPPLIVAGRGAVAKLKTTKLLRPQALPVKLLGVGGQCMVANIPCGAIREHTEKFSVQWFLAVHATVPFFAFMRKGVGMPKWGIALTLAAAIAGQTIGAKLEKARIAYALETQRQRGLDEARGLPCAERSEIGQKCPVLKTCSEIAQSQLNLPAASLHQQLVL